MPSDLLVECNFLGNASQATLNQLLSAMNNWRDRMVSFDGRNRQLFYLYS